ncbi:raffinose/stachyose/melibiose transport system permease protein [Pseudarthrobacter defluvii]|uniref:carbohydrate ABC transporter permease n=1 Tax=Pseudarthrobacter defluvii TaxID=410837 RepID=UPI0027830BC2|nr:sugar ABC transporter permease [Pseudarthrobacter defluvii]MDQ0767413.1 raffinose/stachyose/melibiose transport system permease protein [Pseudarthrobacter defluvii]
MSSVTKNSARAAVTPAAAPKVKRARKSRVDPLYYFFLFPSLVIFTLAVTLPAILGFVYSFTNSVGFGKFEFIGIRNFIAVFRDEGILGAYGFTLAFSLLTVIVVNVLAFLLALGLTSRVRFRTALRTVFVIPMVISGIVIAFVFQYLFSNSLPLMGKSLGIEPLATSILANPDLAWLGIVFVTAWQSIPSAMLIYIAGLLTVPPEVYEASSLDGASPWHNLRHITLPLVAGYAVINTVLGFKNYLNAYDIIVGLTDGGPGVSTRSVAMAIFRGFEGGDYAYQMANAVIFFLISITIALIQLRFTRGKGGIA